MPDVFELRIPASRVLSLAWDGDTLIDLASGDTRYQLDGSQDSPSILWGYPFDAVATLDGSDLAVVYTRFGTKGLLLKGTEVVRELNRSFYHADAYEYPVCLVRHGERVLLIHCPAEYNRLEIEDATTGERLTHRGSKSADFFHSRLAANRSGTRLLSAGWVWHPWDAVVYFDIAEALRDPSHLDSIEWRLSTSRNVGLAEESFACWQTETRSIVAGGEEAEDPEEAAELMMELRLRPRGLVVYETVMRSILSSVVLDHPPGRVMPIGETHVVTFYDHPRLVRLSDGVVEHVWAALSTGKQTSSIYRGAQLPPLALDPVNARFAVAQNGLIDVIQIRSL